jgi:hypothetical protein
MLYSSLCIIYFFSLIIIIYYQTCLCFNGQGDCASILDTIKTIKTTTNKNKPDTLKHWQIIGLMIDQPYKKRHFFMFIIIIIIIIIYLFFLIFFFNLCICKSF